MDTDILREFTIFAQYLNISAAAKATCTSQPTLSRHIAKLEDELGVELVTRGPDMGLTYAGSTLLIEASKLLRCEDELRQAIENAKNTVSGRLKIEDYPYMRTVMSAVNTALNNLQNNNPELYLTVDFLQPKKKQSIIDSVRFGYFDIAVLAHTTLGKAEFPDMEGIEIVPLRTLRSKICFFMSNENPLAKSETVSISDMMNAEVLIPINLEFEGYREDILNVFGQFGITPLEIPYRLGNISDFGYGTLRDHVHILTEADLTTPTSPYLNNPHCKVVYCKEDVGATPYLLYRKNSDNIALRYLLEELEKITKNEA